MLQYIKVIRLVIIINVEFWLKLKDPSLTLTLVLQYIKVIRLVIIIINVELWLKLKDPSLTLTLKSF